MTGRLFSPGTPVTSTNKTDRHDITEILLKVALNTINQIKPKQHNKYNNILCDSENRIVERQVHLFNVGR